MKFLEGLILSAVVILALYAGACFVFWEILPVSSAAVRLFALACVVLAVIYVCVSSAQKSKRSLNEWDDYDGSQQ